MALHDRIDDTLLRRLAELTGMPMITVAAPTHRFGPEVPHDQVTLVDMVEALRRSDTHGAWPEFAAAVDRLADEVGRVDWQHMLDGVLIYAGARAWGHLALGVPVARRVSVSTRVALSAAVHAAQSHRPAWVLGLADAGARLWHKDGTALTEVTATDFPFVLLPTEDRGQGDWDFGRQRTALDLTHRERIVGLVEQRLGRRLADEPVPVFVAGAAKLVARFHEAMLTRHHIEIGRLASLNHPSPDDLEALGRQVDEQVLAVAEQALRRALDAARSSRRLACELDEITELVNDGNATALLFDMALIDAAPETIVQRLDHLVAVMIARGDDVTSVPGAVLGDDGPHVLITRY